MSQASRTIFIGDIHGCKEELVSLLAKLGYRKGNDELILLGDLINKGPDSIGVLQVAEGLGCRILLGNHEWSFLRSVGGRGFRAGSHMEQVAIAMGGDIEHWAAFIKTFAPFLETERYIAVHGGLVPGRSAAESDPYALATIRTWDGRGEDLQDERNPPWHSFYRGSKPVIYGHWAKQGLRFDGETYGLDSGCVYGKSLSAYILEEKRLVCVPARRAYCVISEE